MDELRILDNFDFVDLEAIPNGYDVRYIPKATSKNMEILVDRINKIITVVNVLIPKESEGE